MVRRDLVARKVARGSAWLADTRRLIDRPVEQFLADAQGRDLTAFYLLLAIQECIDLAAHWVADAGWTPSDDAASTFDTLAARGVLSTDLAARLRASAGLRNRLKPHRQASAHKRRRMSVARRLAPLPPGPQIESSDEASEQLVRSGQVDTVRAIIFQTRPRQLVELTGIERSHPGMPDWWRFQCDQVVRGRRLYLQVVAAIIDVHGAGLIRYTNPTAGVPSDFAANPTKEQPLPTFAQVQPLFCHNNAPPTSCCRSCRPGAAWSRTSAAFVLELELRYTARDERQALPG